MTPPLRTGEPTSTVICVGDVSNQRTNTANTVVAVLFLTKLANHLQSLLPSKPREKSTSGEEAKISEENTKIDC